MRLTLRAFYNQKHLNAAYKLIKHKFDGPQGKIRIQTPAQKTFVLLQSAIGQQYLEDYTLRQEMSLIVDNASRILSAAEEFSIEESKHGKVALECILMRRCLATSLWGEKDNVLNQIIGVGQKTAAKLAMSNIRTFQDLVSKSSDEIEGACGRISPFGQKLRAAAIEILKRRIILSAQIEGLHSPNEDNVLVCQLELDDGMNKDISDPLKRNDKEIVNYTLVVHTDRPGGALMFRSNLVGPSCHRIICSPKFGRIYIRLVSNFIGLDTSMIIDGNDTVQKASFTLTPVKNERSAEKKNKKVNRSKQKKQANPSVMEHMVAGIEDLRVPKRTKLRDVKLHSVRTPSSSKLSAFPSRNKEIEKSSDIDRSVVTPSPMLQSLARGMKRKPKMTTNNASPKCREQQSMQSTPKQNSSYSQAKRPRSNPNTWREEKREQKVLQQRAFGKKKDNPFSSFKFDPNDSEKQLEQESQRKSETGTAFNNDTPSSYRSPMNQGRVSSIHTHQRPRFLSRQRTYSGTPLESNTATFIGSARRQKSATSSFRPRGQDLLRQKAEEQQTYAIAMQELRSSRKSYYRPSPINRRSTYIPHHTQNEILPHSLEHDNWNAYSNNHVPIDRAMRYYNHQDSRVTEDPTNVDYLIYENLPSTQEHVFPTNEFVHGSDETNFQGIIYNDRPSAHYLQCENSNHEWDPMSATYSARSNLVQPNESRPNYNLPFEPTNSLFNGQTFQNTRQQNELQHDINRSQIQSNGMDMNQMLVGHVEDPQGMIITVEDEGKGSHTIDPNGEVEFDNAFFE